jgi:predicted transcriptional regulator
MTALRAVHRTDLLALLEGGPKSTGELAIALGCSNQRVVHVLRQMHRAGEVVQTGAAKRWTLPEQSPPSPSRRG